MRKYLYATFVLALVYMLFEMVKIDKDEIEMYEYKVKEFVSSFVLDVNASRLDDNIFQLEHTQANSKCTLPKLRYDDTIAMKYLADSVQSLSKTFEACKLKDYYEFVEINDDEILVNASQSYKIRIKSKNFMLKFVLTNLTSIKCAVNRFDKMINISETQNKLVFYEKYELNIANKHEISVNTHGFYAISCTHTTLLKESTIYEDVFFILPRKMSLLLSERSNYTHQEAKIRSLINESSENITFSSEPWIRLNDKQMNVILLGFDSLSKNHFKRIFPLTYALLKRQLSNNIIFENFNSVGGNTYPNLIPFFSGIIEEEVESENLKSEIDKYRKVDQTFHDHLPFLWYDYEKQGYVTMFQEDKPAWAIFNYLKNGFRYKPSALYGRPYWIKYSQLRNNLNMCHHGKPSYVTYFEMIQKFVERMHDYKENQHLPYFSFNFLTEYTHDYFAISAELDQYFANLLKLFETRGYLNKTLLIVFSDHGMRMNKFGYATELGKLEKYLPFLSIRLPNSLQNTFYSENMLKNRLKLIGAHDIYQTLRQFLHLNSNFTQKPSRDQYKLNSRHRRYLRGISLFEEIPTNRSCGDALIPEKQCNCFKTRDINEIEFQNYTKLDFKFAIEFLLNNINNLTSNHGDICVTYKFNEIKSVKAINLHDFIAYRFLVIFQPGDAWFESNLKLEGTRNLSIIGTINRLSPYGDTSQCVDDFFLRNYCYCKKQLLT